MKRLFSFLFLLLLLCASGLSGAIYYVDFTTGDDGDSGLTEALAWKTIAKVNGATFAGDDQILFKCGETWRETLIPHNNGTSGHQITYGSYGTGAKPRILGSTQISTWADETGNHWSATLAAAPAQAWFVAPTTGIITPGDKKTYSDLIDIGNAGGDRGSNTALGYTLIGTANPANATGTINQIQFYLNIAATAKSVKFGVFYLSGVSKYTCRSVVTLTVTGAANTLVTLNAPADFTAMNVVAGDFVGTYTNDDYTRLKRTSSGTGTGTFWYYSGDATTSEQTYGDGGSNDLALYMAGTEESELVNEYDWCHNGTTLYVYAATDPDTRYASVEAAQRDCCMYAAASGSVTRDYITVDGLEFAFPYDYGISTLYPHSTPGWIIQNCKFTNCGLILCGESSIIQDNIINGACAHEISYSDGALIITKATATNCIIRRNTIYDYYSRGIWVVNSVASPTVQDNIVHDIHNNTTVDTEAWGIDLDGYGNPLTGIITCTGNIVYNCGTTYGIGLLFENAIGGSLTSCNLVYGCSLAIMYNNVSTWIGDDINAEISYNIIHDTNRGIHLADCSTVNIWNNVIFADTEASTQGIYLAGTAVNVNTIDVQNNIFGAGTDYCVWLVDADWTNQMTAFDYNAVGTPAIAVIYEADGPTNLSLAQLQAAGKALHCFATDPGFVDAAGHDYHLLATSPCINAGVDVGLTEDFEGNTVPQGATPDIGAYEYEFSFVFGAGELLGLGMLTIDGMNYAYASSPLLGLGIITSSAKSYLNGTSSILGLGILTATGGFYIDAKASFLGVGIMIVWDEEDTLIIKVIKKVIKKVTKRAIIR